MARAVLVRGGATLFGVAPTGQVERLGDWPPGGTSPEGAPLLPPLPSVVLDRVRRWAGAGALACDGADLVAALGRGGLPAEEGDRGELRAAREALPRLPVRDLRVATLARARQDLARALADPEEVLVVLAREEERLERALGREESAQAELGSAPSEAYGRYAGSGERLRAELDRHLSVLRSELTTAALRTAPNLTELLGPSLTARLVAAAGGLHRLATVSGARLQLLGSRRRPSPTRGPRYGFIYRAPRMTDLPPGRRAAYARSLAALAVIAARADAFTHRSIASALVARRDRRVSELRRRG